MRPKIGVTMTLQPDGAAVRQSVPAPYLEALAAAGALPVPIPLLPGGGASPYLDMVDGLLLTGGTDVDPTHYGEHPHPRLGEITPERDPVELELARLAAQRAMPLLGICRGAQVLAVAGGARLYQDIPSQVEGFLKHSQEAPRWYPTHPVRIQPGTNLAALLEVEHLSVNSYHHQAAAAVPDGWRLTAMAPDGVIEGFELPGHPFAQAVQWHPELMWERDPLARRLFETLVRAAAGLG